MSLEPFSKHLIREKVLPSWRISHGQYLLQGVFTSIRTFSEAPNKGNGPNIIEHISCSTWWPVFTTACFYVCLDEGHKTFCFFTNVYTGPRGKKHLNTIVIFYRSVWYNVILHLEYFRIEVQLITYINS